MKKVKIFLPLIAVILLSGCGQVKEHVHEYVETITKEPTCVEDGIRTFTCACGATYDVAIASVEHSFGKYVYDENSTYDVDGTETATCKYCGKTKTRTAEGSRFKYKTIVMEPTIMYARCFYHIQDTYNAEHEGYVDSINPGDHFVVTAKIEPGTYRIDYNCEVEYIRDFALISRNASDFREIEDLSELERHSGVKAWIDFWAENDKYELVVYTHNDTSVLLYNCVWTDEGKEYVPFFLFDDYDSLNFECVVELDKLDAAIENGGYYYNYSYSTMQKYRSISDFQVY